MEERRLLKNLSGYVWLLQSVAFETYIKNKAHRGLIPMTSALQKRKNE